MHEVKSPPDFPHKETNMEGDRNHLPEEMVDTPSLHILYTRGSTFGLSSLSRSLSAPVSLTSPSRLLIPGGNDAIANQQQLEFMLQHTRCAYSGSGGSDVVKWCHMKGIDVQLNVHTN